MSTELDRNTTSLREARDALGDSPHDFEHQPAAEAFDHYLIGALSALVDPWTWDKAIVNATRCVTGARADRARLADAP